MRSIAGPGAVSGRFVDYDAVLNPDGTVYTADHGNDVQDELLAIEAEFSIPESAGSNAYVLAAIKGIAIKLGKSVGEMFFLDSEKDPTAFDKDDPESFFPGLCLDTIDVYSDISSTNWPDLVTHLRSKALTYLEGRTGEKATFSVTGWDISSNVATLTFENLTAEVAILSALAEDNLVHGSYSNWRSITLPSDIGDITAGEYLITEVDPSARTIKFSFSASNNSGSGTYSANFYINRIPGSTTTARVYEASARTLVSANDSDGEAINGLRRRDRFQGHEHRVENKISENGGVYNWTLGAVVAAGTYYGDNDKLETDETITDGTNGTPRTGSTTDPRAQVGHLYLWGRSYAV